MKKREWDVSASSWHPGFTSVVPIRPPDQNGVLSLLPPTTTTMALTAPESTLPYPSIHKNKKFVVLSDWCVVCAITGDVEAHCGSHRDGTITTRDSNDCTCIEVCSKDGRLTLCSLALAIRHDRQSGVRHRETARRKSCDAGGQNDFPVRTHDSIHNYRLA